MATGSQPRFVGDWLTTQLLSTGSAASAQGGKPVDNNPVDNKPAGLMIRASRVIDKASSE